MSCKATHYTSEEAILESHIVMHSMSHGEITPCQVEHHVRTNFATPILYAIDNLKNYDFFSTYT